MANERQAPQSELKQLISKGLEQGYLTYAEVNDHLPDDVVDPEQIEDIIGMINGLGIQVHEVAPDAETLLLAGESASGREVDETAAEEAAAALSGLDAEGGRTTDPVRMYMREMGTVELLTREGEIAIAKRIEEGLSQVQASLGNFPWSIELLLEEYELHKAGKKRLAEVVVGFNDVEEPVEEVPAPEEVADAAEDADDDEESGDDAADAERAAFSLQQVARATETELKRIAGTRDVATIGGPGHVIRVDMDTERMNAHGITAQDLRGALQLANASQPAGSLVAGNKEVLVQTGTYLESAEDVRKLVVGVQDRKPVFLRDVAEVIDGPDQPSQYVWFGTGAAAEARGIEQQGLFPAVTLALSKKPGANAADVAQAEATLAALEGGPKALVFSSGMSAATACFLALAPGDHAELAPARAEQFADRLQVLAIHAGVHAEEQALAPVLQVHGEGREGPEGLALPVEAEQLEMVLPQVEAADRIAIAFIAFLPAGSTRLRRAEQHREHHDDGDLCRQCGSGQLRDRGGLGQRRRRGAYRQRGGDLRRRTCCRRHSEQYGRHRQGQLCAR